MPVASMPLDGVLERRQLLPQAASLLCESLLLLLSHCTQLLGQHLTLAQLLPGEVALQALHNLLLPLTVPPVQRVALLELLPHSIDLICKCLAITTLFIQSQSQTQNLALLLLQLLHLRLQAVLQGYLQAPLAARNVFQSDHALRNHLPCLSHSNLPPSHLLHLSTHALERHPLLFDILFHALHLVHDSSPRVAPRLLPPLHLPQLLGHPLLQPFLRTREPINKKLFGVGSRLLQLP
mmetsp:Transcript_133415/g.345367  ORF Transcript_133415/g.345367 Transcript_133415/m.345367 type:complete len:237 (-) Transcript_133415:98-808(-)